MVDSSDFKGKYLFERNIVEVVSVKHACKVLIAIVAMVSMYEELIQQGISKHIGIAYALPLSLMIWLAYYIFFRSYAYKLMFDYDNHSAEFHMFYKDKINIRIDDIKYIAMGFCVHVCFTDGRSISYKGYDDQEFLAFIKKMKFETRTYKVGRFVAKMFGV